jgi:hypothetical protein
MKQDLKIDFKIWKSEFLKWSSVSNFKEDSKLEALN